MTEITMRQLLKAGVHFGHQTRYWSPSMAPYIFDKRNKIHIINLDKTLPMLKEAMNYIGAITAQQGKVLFVGTKRTAGKAVKEQALRCATPYVDHRWLGGMLTNFKTVKNSIVRLKELEQRVSSTAIMRLSKKEALSLDRERAKLDRTLAGIKDMNGLPDALFVIDVEHEYIAVTEANKLGIPVIAVVDTNCSLKGIDYVIPGNDDSSKSIMLYLEAAADTIIESRTAAQHPAVAGNGDEYIEVDKESDASPPVIKSSGTLPATEPPATSADSPPITEEKPTKKIVKKVTKKKATASGATKDDKKGADKTATLTVTKKKKVPQKKVTTKAS